MMSTDLERLPESIINEILLKLDVESLCSAACVSILFRNLVYLILSSQSSLHLSGFSPDSDTIYRIQRRLGELERISLDCLRLDKHVIYNFLRPNVQYLNLFKCSLLPYAILSSIGQNCPHLRELTLEFVGHFLPEKFQKHLAIFLQGCPFLESICITIRATEIDSSGFTFISDLLPKTIKFLKLQPMFNSDALRLAPSFADSPVTTLKYLSLTLDIITDDLILTIVNSLPLLVELDLEDRPNSQPSRPYDLTSMGLMSLNRCNHLTHLSLVRGQHNCEVYFEEISDMGMILLSKGCQGLKSLRLGGFSRVQDEGFTSLFNSFPNLEKIEIHNAVLLSDLTFNNIRNIPLSLLEIRLVSCNMITNESVEELASFKTLQVLDLLRCSSVGDFCLGAVSSCYALTHLNLSGTDVTNYGMVVLGEGSSPIMYLSLRGCKRVTDRGIRHLLHGEGRISKTLTSLDLGHMPGISDSAILTIAEDALAITQLCIRHCYCITNASVKAFGSPDRRLRGANFLRGLDLHHCPRITIELLEKPLFPGLRWVGVGSTRLTSKWSEALEEIEKERPWLTVCSNGCEIGCENGWQFHMYDNVTTFF